MLSIIKRVLGSTIYRFNLYKVIGKAMDACFQSVSAYLRAVSLDADYKPLRDPELTYALLATNRELTAQGNKSNAETRFETITKFIELCVAQRAHRTFNTGDNTHAEI
jgi:hypothetical protein